jgi:hypothetical protein
MPSRRSVLVGLGGLVAGGGALIGTGAFTTVEAERTVSVETSGDANAFLGLEAVDRGDTSSATPETATPSGATQNEYVRETDGTIEINLDGSGDDEDSDDDGTGLNQNAITTFRELVTVSNNGTQDIETLNMYLDVDSDSVGDFTATEVENAFAFTVPTESGSTTVDNSTDTSSDNNMLGNGSVSNPLGPGESFNFGLEIDLLNGNISDLPDGANYTLIIEALTANNDN